MLNNLVELGPSLSGFLDKFVSFPRLVFQTNVLNPLLCKRKIPSFTRESISAPLGMIIKYMIKAGNDRKIRAVGQSVSPGDKIFEVVKEFVYLGSLVTPNDDVSLEIQRKIHTVNRCFFGLPK
jgi:hypothetical protein